MKNYKYTCVSGYHRGNPEQCGYDTFFKIWLNNVSKLTPTPQQIIIIADNRAHPPMADCPPEQACRVTVVPLQGDLGCCHALLSGAKPHKFSGWTGVVLAGALLAYTNETDLVFFEEDALAFGHVIWKMYEEIGDAGVIFGSTDGMPCAQSLFLVRHSYIPEFVRLFLSQESQQMKENLGEEIFKRLEQERPKEWVRFSFGYDRTRPVNYDDPVWYLQHITPEEMEELKLRNLI